MLALYLLACVSTGVLFCRRLLEGYGDSNSSKIKPTAINRPKRGLGSFLRARKREKELQLNR